MFWDDETCEVCENPVTSENGYKIESVAWEQVKEDGSKSWGSDSYSFCSLECLFKWTWDQMVPSHLYFKAGHPRSVVELETRLISEDINKKAEELLVSIGIRKHIPCDE